MEEYTYDNVIINPTQEGIESLIGKEVYFHENPYICLERANKDSLFGSGILVKIRKDLANPFHVEQSNGVCACPCIIPKKELKPEFVPFESADEFLDEYDNANYSVNSGTLENKLLNYGGIWLKGKDSRAYYMVTEIWDCGLVIDDINMKTTKIEEDLYFTVNGVTHWDELLGYYTFLDGSPCGKLRKNK